jgi:TIR domain/Pentapeptide repeats (8 copies)
MMQVVLLYLQHERERMRIMGIDNQELVDLLRKNIKEWNKWRSQHLNTAVDLSRANLIGADLSYATLTYAILSYAHLRGANLSYANLIGANLSYANLIGANLINADLSAADLSECIVNHTQFGDRDFRTIKDLDTIRHGGPSSLSINSIYESEGDIPEAFVRGTGAPDSFIEYMHALAARPIDYYTCFLSYSHEDQEFTKRLYADLQAEGVRCWYAPHELIQGDYYRDKIATSIRVYDKLILILTEHSVNSEWVEREVKML